MNQFHANDASREPISQQAHTTPDPDAPNDPLAPPPQPPVPDDVPDPVNAPVEEPSMPEPPIRAH
jgi:protein TonB